MSTPADPHPSRSLVAALVVAAGRGVRAGGGPPKQYRALGSASVLARSLAAFAGHEAVGAVLAVIHPEDEALYRAAATGLPKLRPPALGGASRQASVLAGLRALDATSPDIVLIHDAARPFASSALIGRAVAEARRHGAAVPGIAVTDTIKHVSAEGLVDATPQRSALRAVQTPQAFHYRLIRAAHEQAAAAGIADLTDDGAVAEWAGHPTAVFEGEATNMKLTDGADFEAAERRLSPLAALGDVRTGTGFDVHAACEGDHVWLGGLRLAHHHGLSGHSDADVGLHALTDAVLGAIGDGDIGSHFPPSDMRWRGASSDRFLAFAAERVRARGGLIANLDLTILCEAPKVGPHRDAMRERIAAIAGMAAERVGVKATTTEGLGFTGRGEGIAAMALATVRLPWITP